jgi:hypothetical protein
MIHTFLPARRVVVDVRLAEPGTALVALIVRCVTAESALESGLRGISTLTADHMILAQAWKTNLQFAGV